MVYNTSFICISFNKITGRNDKWSNFPTFFFLTWIHWPLWLSWIRSSLSSVHFTMLSAMWWMCANKDLCKRISNPTRSQVVLVLFWAWCLNHWLHSWMACVINIPLFTISSSKYSSQYRWRKYNICSNIKISTKCSLGDTCVIDNHKFITEQIYCYGPYSQSKNIFQSQIKCYYKQYIMKKKNLGIFTEGLKYKFESHHQYPLSLVICQHVWCDCDVETLICSAVL